MRNRFVGTGPPLPTIHVLDQAKNGAHCVDAFTAGYKVTATG